MRAAQLVIAAAALAGCACQPLSSAAGPEPLTCPALRRAEAWVNRMPGPQAPDKALIVLVELETSERWMLRRTEEPQNDHALVLELVPGGAGHPGSAAYRGAASAEWKRVDIRCDGDRYHLIQDILTAN